MKKIKFLNMNDEMNKLATIFISVSLLFIAFYMITVFVTNKPKVKVPTIVNLQYEEILVGSISNRGEENYYVLAYDKSNVNHDLYSYFLEEYSYLPTSTTFYTVDLGNIFNKPFIQDESLFNDQTLFFKEDTILKISKGKIVEVTEGKEEIVNLFENLIAKIDS